MLLVKILFINIKSQRYFFTQRVNQEDYEIGRQTWSPQIWILRNINKFSGKIPVTR